MADRSVALTTVRGGINRQRTKGGALEDSLYDLVNGYVSESKTVVVRPGTFRHANLGGEFISGRGFTADDTESPTYPGILLSGYMDIPGDPYGTGALGALSSASSYDGFPVVGIFYQDSERTFTAGEVDSTAFGNVTLYGYVGAVVASYYETGTTGSMTSAVANYAGFPIVGIFYPDDGADFVWVTFGKDSAGDLPDDNFFNTVLFEMSDSGGVVATGLMDGDIAAFGADAKGWRVPWTSPPVSGTTYTFAFTPDPAAPESVIWIVFGRNTDDDLPTTADFAGVSVTVEGPDGEVASSAIGTDEAPFGDDARGWAIHVTPPPFVSGDDYTFSFDPEDTPVSAAGLTKGLCAFEGALHVFATQLVDLPDNFDVHILSHPDATADEPIEIETIEFAAPFMGYLYVVATFDNGDTYHFWLQSGEEWQPETVYSAGDIVVGSDETGLSYQATRLGDPNASWQANITREVGDIIEPTEYNDFYYTVVEVQGDNPRSGTTEPTWPTEDGARVFEDADGAADTPPTVTQPPNNSDVPSPGISDRYANLFRGR